LSGIFDETENSWADEDDALRDLIERQHLILAMQETAGWGLWRDYVAAVAAAYQRRLLKGTHTDLLAYKWDAGVVEGIRIALGSSETLQSKVSAARRILDEQKEALSGIDAEPQLATTED
jgi:hypothetical protein